MPSQTFTPGSGWQRFNVPKGVSRVTVDLKGGGSAPANGGRVQGQIKVKDTDVLYILVGEAGQPASGANGGGTAAGGGGAGGDAAAGNTGGRGGGGASAIRMNSSTGTLKAVAGGAGGKSGDGGVGGDGGGTTGGFGNAGTAGAGVIGNATGGTQIQGGKGGTSSAAASLSGGTANNTAIARGGRGGQDTGRNTHGGGGGGGGYRSGGGGAAAFIGATPGGGGGGGSSFTGGLYTGVSASQGGASTGDGSVLVSWVGPPPANQPPSAPSDAKIDGKADSPGLGTKSTGRVTVSAVLHDQGGKDARLLVRYSPHKGFSHGSQKTSDLVGYGKRASVVLTGLSTNTHYYGRLYAVDRQGKVSGNYNAIDFWTNRNPNAPTLQSPSDNGVILSTDAITFNWAHNDPDPNDGQSAFEIRWRRARDSTSRVGDWETVRQVTSFDNWVTNPGQFKGGVYYEWTVRTRDQQNAWGNWAIPRSFFARDVTFPPLITSPVKGQAVDATDETLLGWRFRDPNSGATQQQADYRFRVVGAADWVTVLGDTDTPGAAETWTVPMFTFQAGFHYEWQMRTYVVGGTGPSDWSDSETFWTHSGVGVLAGATVVDDSTPFEKLGTGTHRAFIYDRGGKVMRGEITPLTQVQWTRQRDDLSTMSITTNGFGSDCGQLLAGVHTWINELVIFRDGVRVMEGPITLIEDDVDGFTIQAKDVMGYVYRRIMMQGYNDSYHLVNGIEEGLLSVVQRARLIIADALVRDDPNVLPYITSFEFPNDARQSRSVVDFGKTAWEEVDDMAANAGLDYSTIGRRIILNDTHRPIGRLPEFRPNYFSAPPKITEYGMLLADLYAVTNNA
jgi:hypothetical protein